MRDNEERCLANTLAYEGGFSNHPKDPGGATMRGVTQQRYNEYRDAEKLPRRSVALIDKAELRAIYHVYYWSVIAGDHWPKGTDQIAFDIAVNSGPARSPQIMSKAINSSSQSSALLVARAAAMPVAARVNVVQRACGLRERYYRSLPIFPTFGRGWLRRNAAMEAIAVKMISEEAGDGDRLLKAQTAKAAKAQANSARAGAAAGATSATTGTTSAVGQWNFDWGWVELLLAFGIVLACTAVALYALAKCYQHKERVLAYLDAQRGKLEHSWDDVFTS